MSRHKLKRLCIAAFFILTGYTTFAAHIIIAPSVCSINATTSPYNTIQPGDTLLFQAGTKQYIQVRNFTGTAAQPIVMINMGGAVNIGTNYTYGIKIAHCKYVKFTGTGTAGVTYGFHVTQTNGDGVAMDELSSNIEVDHLNLENCGCRGIVAKTDPDCNFNSTREKFTQYNTWIHDVNIYNTTYEGMYIGSSFYGGETINCNGKDTLVYPSLLNGVRIYNNTVNHTGWDGIQVGSASNDCQIYGNLVMYDSQTGASSQMSGILIGGGTRADVYRNYIYKGKGDGVESLGLGNYKIHNNTIVGAGTGYTGGPKYGIYQNDNSAQAGSSVSILFNNIINPLTNGIKFMSTVTANNLIASNVIINPGSGTYIVTATSGNVTISNNYTSMTSTGAGFTDTLYHISSTSPLINAGYSDNRGITIDYFNQTRPSGATFDIGVCEYCSSGPTLATVTTSNISNITPTTATGGGNITADGGAAVTARGVCWSTTANPTTANSKTTNGTGTGAFTSNLTGLTANTLYYVRAYAVNSVGTAYGNQVTFTTTSAAVPPTVTTTNITNITTSTATGGGNVTADGGASVTARGVCWSTAANPTTANSKTSDGTGTGAFTSSLTGLTPGTLYYVRAYATNSVGTSYGNQVTFTTATVVVPPTVTTASITNIAPTTANGGGTVTADGGAAVTARGVCWSTSANPTTTNSKTVDGTGTGVFLSTLTGLTPNTMYYVRAYAINSAGTSYGNQVTFTTAIVIIPPTVTTATITNITMNSATGGGNVTYDGGAAVTARGVCWSTAANPTTANSKTVDGSGTGTFTSSLTGLASNTLYYVRAYATNSAGTSYGNQVTFTTLSGIATVTTSPITNITRRTAIGGGNVTSSGGSTVTSRGVCWSTSQNPTTANYKTTDGSGLGKYSSYLTNLRSHTRYYVRAYAINSYGTAYGNQVTFVTAGNVSTDGPDSTATYVPDDNVIAENSFLLYPNPVVTTLNVKYNLLESSDVEISVYDLRGARLYYTETNLSAGEPTYSINVSTLPEGFYMLTSRIGGKVTTGKFIKQR